MARRMRVYTNNTVKKNSWSILYDKSRHVIINAAVVCIVFISNLHGIVVHVQEVIVMQSLFDLVNMLCELSNIYKQNYMFVCMKAYIYIYIYIHFLYDLMIYI